MTTKRGSGRQRAGAKKLRIITKAPRVRSLLQERIDKEIDRIVQWLMPSPIMFFRVNRPLHGDEVPHLAEIASVAFLDPKGKIILKKSFEKPIQLHAKDRLHFVWEAEAIEGWQP